MKKRVLFLINGLGLGNSTRCHAVMQYLKDKDAEIDVITSGNGVWYLGNQPEVNTLHETEPLYYGKKDGRLSILKTIFSLRDFKQIMEKNAQTVKDVVNKFKPHVAVTDSIYTYRPMKEASVPIVAINNADVVCLLYRRYADKPDSIRLQYHFVELMDYYFHRIIPDMTISPVLDMRLPLISKKFRRVGPLVRKEFDYYGNTAMEIRKKAKRVVIMLSGSTFASPVILQRSHPVNIDIVGRAAPQNSSSKDNVVYHGKVMNTFPLLKDAELVVVNGGFSAVSEMFYLRKPMIVLPVPNHAEQWINARTIENMNLGMMANEENYEDKITEALSNIEKFQSAYEKLPPATNGAIAAAELICKV